MEKNPSLILLIMDLALVSTIFTLPLLDVYVIAEHNSNGPLSSANRSYNSPQEKHKDTQNREGNGHHQNPLEEKS